MGSGKTSFKEGKISDKKRSHHPFTRQAEKGWWKACPACNAIGKCAAVGTRLWNLATIPRR